MTAHPQPTDATPRHWLFDLDGTLVHTAPDIARALNRLLAGQGLAAVPVAQVTHWVGTGARELIRTALAAQGRTAADDELAALLAAYAADTEANPVVEAQLYEGAEHVLRTLVARGDRLAIVTNKLSAVARNVLQHFGLADCFVTLVGASDVAVGKPDPAPLLEACRRLGVAPAACVMVGDSRNDVRAARAAGMPVIAVDYGYNHGEPIAASNPDRLVASLSALL